MEYQFKKEPGCVMRMMSTAFVVLLALIVLVIATFAAQAGAPWLTQLLTEMGVF